MKKVRGFILLFILSLQIHAQCGIENNFFQSGEELTYDLYFKYGLIDTKAGISTLKILSEKYNNTDAYKMTMIAKSVGMVNKVFSLADTLSCYMSKDLMPLAYMKNAHEGNEHSKELTTYNYSSGTIIIKAKLIRNGILRFDETFTSTSCIYDMMSILYYARALNYSNMKKGDIIGVSFLSGKDKVNMDIEYKGTETIMANDSKKYSCIKLILNINDKAFESKKEAMEVFITNDENRMPVQINSKLKIGSTRVTLKSYKGNRHTVKSI